MPIIPVYEHFQPFKNNSSLPNYQANRGIQSQNPKNPFHTPKNSDSLLGQGFLTKQSTNPFMCVRLSRCAIRLTSVKLLLFFLVLGMCISRVSQACQPTKISWWACIASTLSPYEHGRRGHFLSVGFPMANFLHRWISNCLKILNQTQWLVDITQCGSLDL